MSGPIWRTLPADQRANAKTRWIEASRGGLALCDVKARLAGQAEEWELKNDLALLKQLGLVDSHGHGRGSYWALRQK